MADEPVLIRRTSTLEEAEIIVSWLDEQGIEAIIPDRSSPGVFAFGVTDTEGIEIYARDEDTAGRARKLLEEHDRQRAAGAGGDTSGADGAGFDVTCDECGRVDRFPAGAKGTVQSCTNCGAFLDMPGSEE